MPVFASHLEKTLHRSLGYASDRGHVYATLEHMLLGLLDDPSAAECMIACQVDIEELRSVVTVFLDQEYETLTEDGDDGLGVDPQPTAGFQRVIQRAILHTQTKGDDEVTGTRVLTSLFSERDSYAVYFLQQQDFSRLDAVSYDAHGIGKKETTADQESGGSTKLDWDVDFFVSYSHKNDTEAREVVEILEALGFSTIAQFKDFTSGSNFVVEMQRALEKSLRVVPLYSDEYFESEHCQAEWAAAYNTDPTGKNGAMMPLLLSPSKMPPLARQIVFTSLVGLGRQEKAIKIVEAIKGPEQLKVPRAEALDAIISKTLSPDVELRGSKLGIGPNEDLDEVVDYPALMEAGRSIEGMVDVILENLPSNSPPIVNSCLQKYTEHLANHRRRPISGLLSALSSAVERELASDEADLWDTGVGNLLESFLLEHGKLVTALKGEPLKEKIIRSVSIASETVDTTDIAEKLEEGQRALEIIIDEGLGDEEFNDLVKQQGEILRSNNLAEPTSDQIKKGFFARIVVGSIGFYKRVADIGSSTASLLDSPAAARAFGVLHRIAKALINIFGS